MTKYFGSSIKGGIKDRNKVDKKPEGSRQRETPSLVVITKQSRCRNTQERL